MPVPPEWPSTAPNRIAFVGEAPGADEVIKGVPLVGPSGRVHNAILRTAGIERSGCLTTNLFAEKAPDNDVSDWLRDKVRLNEARARLAEEINTYNPHVIVPLGGSALQGFLGTSNIKTYRGSPVAAEFVVPGRKLLPAYHPAAVMRAWKLMTLSISDYMKAAREAKRGPQIAYPDVTLYLSPTVADVEWYCQRCREIADLLSVDIETGWGQITMIGLAPTADEAMCIPFLDLRRPDKSYWRRAADETRVWQLVGDLLRDPSVPKLGQNFVYDAQWLRDSHVDVMNYRHDTRLLAHAFQPEQEKGLATLGGLYTDIPQWKAWGRHEEKRDA